MMHFSQSIGGDIYWLQVPFFGKLGDKNRHFDL
jgi:hypothetical protein